MCMSPVTIKCPESRLGIFSPLQKYIEVPCGKCDDCRISYAKMWATRCMCEYYSYSDIERERCWFITLTYDEEHNPGYIRSMDMTLFIKRLRKMLQHTGIKIKFFYCAELGTLTKRPHYHMIVYNLPINDLERLDRDYFTSETITKIWGNGMITIGFVSLQSCNYVARYSLKKNDTDCFVRMSQGFGKKYFLDHMNDIVSNGYVTLPKNNKIVKLAIPRYFLKIYRQLIGEKEYGKFARFRQKKYLEYKAKIDKVISTRDKIGYLNRRRLGIRSASEKLLQQCKNILSETRREFYKFRDF